jgi:hypothetical protein
MINFTLKRHPKTRGDSLEQTRDAKTSYSFSDPGTTAGEPENYRYNSREMVVTRENDGRAFDSLDDFICYAFQCDAEGYPNTEYVDLEVLS